MEIKEKKHRLGKSFYLGKVIISFTICIKNKNNLFINENIFMIFKEILYKTAAAYDIDLPAFVFMPDHVHVIVYGKNDKSDCLKMLNMFKQKTGYWLHRNKREFSWQKDYYDHIIKSDKDLENQMYYILNNPVRKGIVKSWQDFSFKGSTMFDLNTYGQ